VHNRNLSTTAWPGPGDVAARTLGSVGKENNKTHETNGGQGLKEKQIPSSFPRDFSSCECHVMAPSRAPGSMTLRCCHWKGAGRGEAMPSSDPLSSPQRREKSVERQTYATRIARHAGVMAVSRNRPRRPVAAVQTRAWLGADSVPRPERIQHRKVQDAGHGPPHFKAALGMQLSVGRHTHTVAANIPRVLRVAQPFPLLREPVLA
jgi:hypothetical protein